MYVFYANDIIGSTYRLNEIESKHCVKVLRLQSGDKIILLDGTGGYHEAFIDTIKSGICTVKISNSIANYKKRSYYLHIAISPTKSHDRFEWFIEKSTELGIDEITPIQCEHSERKHIKHERLEKICISAMKQSIRAFKPKINKLVTFNEIITLPFTGTKLIAHCGQMNGTRILEHYKKGSNVLILIGPEGDFGEDEVKRAIKHNFKGVSLGESRLRTETAGIVACHAIHLRNE